MWTNMGLVTSRHLTHLMIWVDMTLLRATYITCMSHWHTNNIPMLYDVCLMYDYFAIETFNPVSGQYAYFPFVCYLHL